MKCRCQSIKNVELNLRFSFHIYHLRHTHTHARARTRTHMHAHTHTQHTLIEWFVMLTRALIIFMKMCVGKKNPNNTPMFTANHYWKVTKTYLLSFAFIWQITKYFLTKYLFESVTKYFLLCDVLMLTAFCWVGANSFPSIALRCQNWSWV